MSQSSGTYRLKDHRRTVVVDKKVREELDRILETFSIQVDNPIAVSYLWHIFLVVSASQIFALNFHFMIKSCEAICQSLHVRLNKNLIFFTFQILNQDAAKTFLFKCDEYKLYEFFMRATQVCSLKPILFQSFPSQPTNSNIWLTVDLTCMMTQNFSSTGCGPGGFF